MKRRGFLGALLASPVAAKAAADAGISEDPNALNLDMPVAMWGGGVSSGSPDVGSRIARYRRKIAKLALGIEDKKRRELRNVCRLDPDLSVNRSMSLACKMALQAGRNVERDTESQRFWLEDKITKLLSGDDDDDFFD